MSTEIQLAGLSLAEEWAEAETATNFSALADHYAAQIGGEVAILSPTGELLGSSSTDGDDLSIYRDEIQTAMANGMGNTVSEDINSPTLYLAKQILVNGEVAGYLHLTYPTPTFNQLAARIRNTILISFIIFALMTLLPLIQVTNESGKRLREITDAANKIAAGNLDIQIPIGPRDEIGTSAYAINQLAQQVNEQFQILEVEQAKINAVLLHMNEGVMILDEHGQIVITNRSALDLFQIDGNPVIGKRMIRVIQYHQIN
ncbi:MAG: HAMP domain-containing protein, partial [Anaerolineales bacterium]